MQGGEGGEGHEVLAQQTGGLVRVATLLKTPEEGVLCSMVFRSVAVCVTVLWSVSSASTALLVGRNRGCVYAGLGAPPNHEVILE